jgi:hypothetical protein
MASIELTTNGIDVGYGEDGFFAFGVTTAHKFKDDSWEWRDAPIRGMPIQWSIRFSGRNLLKEYVSNTFPESELSMRVPLIQEYFNIMERSAIGKMHRWDLNEPIDLCYHLPNDPSLAAIIASAAAADRDLSIWGPGWYFTDDDVGTGRAASVAGFMERREPAFVIEMPIVKLKR